MPADRRHGPAAVLFACSGGAAVAVALANVGSLAAARDVARVRDLRPLASLRVALDALDVRLLAMLPEIVHMPFDLYRVPALLGFAALAVVVYLACAWITAALAVPVVVPLARRYGGPDGRAPAWLPLAVLAAGLVPVVAHRLGVWTSLGGGTRVLASVAVAAAAFGLGRRRLSDAAARRLIAATRTVTIVGTATALLGVPLALVASAPRAGRPAAPPNAPNVVLVSIDTLRPDHLGSYGYFRDTSPTIDALAAAGARFTTVVSPTSWTLPAHVSLLTALPPEIHGVTEDRFRLGTGVVTLTEVLRRHGWTTGGFVSGPYLDAGYGFARGFDHYDDYSAVRESAAQVHRARTSPTLLAAVTDWLRTRATEEPARPFFLFVHMWDAHYDFNPPPPYDTMFDPDYAGAVTGEDFESGTAVHPGMNPRDLAHVVALYDGEIRYTDEYLGRLLAEVEVAGARDGTIVVVTSDHGEEFFEHGQKGHHKALWEESIRVPLVIRHPRTIPAGTTIDTQVRLVDVAPTLLALAGVAPPPGFGGGTTGAEYGGRDLSPLFGRADALPTIPAVAGLAPFGFAAIRTETHKLMQGFFTAPNERLFDLASDPGERHDLAPSDAATTERLRGHLGEWRRTAADLARATGVAAMSPEHRDALRALGYVE